MNAATIDAGGMAGAYLAMARVFSYPNLESWRQMSDHGLVDPALDREEMEAEYLAAFEVGRDAPPVPLFEGMHREDLGRSGVLEDLLRFYEFFDAKLSEADREYPDHLVTEIEFLAWLCLKEGAAERQGDDAEPFRRAARDFLARHLAAWLPEFRRKLDATDTVYAQYGATLAELVDAHRGRLGAESQEPGDAR
jgi:DMSO reductase family type II enzyme chaperone